MSLLQKDVGHGLQDTHPEPHRVILAHDRIGNHKSWVNCLYLDGHVRGYNTTATTLAAFYAERQADGDLIPTLNPEGDGQ